jgi:hypothetical protein
MPGPAPAPAGSSHDGNVPLWPISLKGYIELPSHGDQVEVGKWVRFVMKRLESRVVETEELSRRNNWSYTTNQPFYQLLEIFDLGREWELEVRTMMKEMIERLCDIDKRIGLQLDVRWEDYQAAADDYALRLRERYKHYIALCVSHIAQEKGMPFGLTVLIGQIESMHIRTARLERAMTLPRGVPDMSTLRW